MPLRSFLPLLGLFFALAAPCAHGRFLAEISGGTAYSLPSQVTIFQDRQANLTFRAEWSNETFRQAPYYALRLGGWTENSGWEFEHVHHKIVLTNNPPEVQAFKATFGFNLFLLNRGWDLKWFILRVGMGPVVAHPITTVRGLVYNSAVGGILGTTYFLVGAALQLSFQRRFHLGDHFYFAVEGKLTAAYADLPVVDGTSHVPNLALHALAGVGYLF